jgi:hypothetical protein
MINNFPSRLFQSLASYALVIASKLIDKASESNGYVMASKPTEAVLFA